MQAAPGIDIDLGVLMDLIATGLPIATAGAMVKALIVSLEKVSWEGKDVIDLITRTARQQGVGPYEPVPLERVRAAFVDATFDFDAVLKELVSKGVVETDDRDRIQLVV